MSGFMEEQWSYGYLTLASALIDRLNMASVPKIKRK